MTEKIIFNGVDVSGCEFLCNGGYWCEQHKILVATNKLQKGDGLISCKNNTNCYYKQLQRTTTQYNAVLEQNKSLQSELLSARSEVSQKTDYIREQLEIIKQLKDKKRELRIETARLSNERTIDIKKQLKQKENEIAHQKTLIETYRSCYLAKHEDLAKELESKKKECKELKKQVRRCSEGWGKASLEKDWYKEAEQFRQEENYYLSMELYKYKQALDEIEEIITPVEYPDVDRKINFGSVCHTQILDIINKAKEESHEIDAQGE